MEAPRGGEQLCVFLLRGAGAEEERRKEVGCQWESPEDHRKEVGCQSEAAERRDAGVQVDLPTQQLTWRHTATPCQDGLAELLLQSQPHWAPHILLREAERSYEFCGVARFGAGSWEVFMSAGSSAMLLQCFAVRPDGPDGGALLQHCTTNRTRTRIIRPATKFSDEPTLTKSRTQRRRSLSQTSNTKKQSRHRQESPDTGQQEEEAEVEEEVVTVVEEEEQEEEEDTGDPTWTPSEGVEPQPLLSALKAVQSDSQHASLCAVKLEPDSTVCDVCGKVMKNKSSLARHSFIHTGKKPFACHLCELRFNRRDNLQHHLNRLHPDGVAKREKQRRVQAWLCAVCGKTFSCRSRLKTHEVIHSGVKPHTCDLCPKAYMRANDLEHHKKVVHVDGATEPPRPSSLLCDFCGKEFKCRSQLAIHFQTHTGERPHLCDICGRKFARQYQLKRHKILVHANHVNSEDSAPPDAPFACGVCGKRLKSEALLSAHTRIHTGDKPHRCSLCLRSFQRATCLKQHHVRVHLKVRGSDVPHTIARRKSATAEKVFTCPICSKVFKFRSLLASHSTIHSDVRPFACEFCSRSFRRLSHLKRHREVVHANGARLPQSFICHICGKDKKCRSQLARHVIIHTGERPFACDLCSARFNRRGNLQQHRKRMHSIGIPADEEVPPILFDDDEALTYKQEETVVDCAADPFEDEESAAQQLDAT